MNRRHFLSLLGATALVPFVAKPAALPLGKDKIMAAAAAGWDIGCIVPGTRSKHSPAAYFFTADGVYAVGYDELYARPDPPPPPFRLIEWSQPHDPKSWNT